ncbi:uncharacterized protein LOC143589914 [Bidens hawaiensis]|uniref:uncharacterized protein LOC143589914 n=1 Tax=Bidens hawaiensis TaxID=980011 RepID=UPI004049B2A8
MVEEEGVFVFDSNTDPIFQEKRAKSSGRIPTRDSKSNPNSSSVKEFIEHLQKENASLTKLLGDKNRIIAVSGAELRTLRITLQKMQQQNLHLAQANSQMLAELNSGKDRLNDLQHQLGCKNGLLIAKEFELEGKRKAKACETNETKKVKVSEHDEMGVCTVAESGKDQHCNSNGRQKSKSLCPAARKVEESVIGDNRRVVARRPSARFKHDEPKPTNDLFHTDEMDDKMQEDDKASSVKKEANSLRSKISQESRRSSISRPSREVAKKVQSYKEISVNVKMRRPE